MDKSDQRESRVLAPRPIATTIKVTDSSSLLDNAILLSQFSNK
jgi:hypothetical protein